MTGCHESTVNTLKIYLNLSTIIQNEAAPRPPQKVKSIVWSGLNIAIYPSTIHTYLNVTPPVPCGGAVHEKEIEVLSSLLL